jgi:hypothetical protein
MKGPLVLVLSAICLGACDSPARPDSRFPPATGTPDRLQLLPENFFNGLGMTKFSLQAGWGSIYETRRDVVAEAEWTSSDPAVVQIVGAGLARSVAPGEAVISATYRGVMKEVEVLVFAGEPPLPFHDGELFFLAIEAGSKAWLAGVTVEIISGRNAGRQGVTDTTGRVFIPGRWICGPMTIRGSKPGYKAETYLYEYCTGTLPVVTLTKS